MKSIGIISVVLALSLTYVIADNKSREYDEDNERKQEYKYMQFKSANKGNSNIKNQLYISECGSCHMAYQSEFLPKRSWNKLMNNLQNHFEVDATLEKKDDIAIRKYLEDNASDSKRVYGEIREFSDSISQNSTPIAISQLPKFKREHDEVPLRLITQKEVKTIANCNACHKDALDGLYKERNILIPNYGRWDN